MKFIKHIIKNIFHYEDVELTKEEKRIAWEVYRNVDIYDYFEHNKRGFYIKAP